MQVGLVDEVGGLLRATDLAKQLAGLPLQPDATIMQEWPPRCVFNSGAHCIVQATWTGLFVLASSSLDMSPP